jgi:hypothetical protein
MNEWGAADPIRIATIPFFFEDYPTVRIIFKRERRQPGGEPITSQRHSGLFGGLFGKAVRA